MDGGVGDLDRPLLLVMDADPVDMPERVRAGGMGDLDRARDAAVGCAAAGGVVADQPTREIR